MLRTTSPRQHGIQWLCAAVVGLLLVVALILDSPTRENAASQVEFQQSVHGVGMGPAVDAAECAFAFDPRFVDSCEFDVGPIPGGGYCCRRHALSVFHY